MSKWLPIESAPKDGTRVLLVDGKFVGISDTYKEWIRPFTDESLSGWVINWNHEFGVPDAWINPTHWQPLPEPPQ